jgi:hypothetical protein
MFDLDTLPKIDPANRIHLERYIRHLELRQLRLHTIRTKVWRVYPFLKWYKFQDVKTVTQNTIEDYILHRRQIVSPFTLQGDILELKMFFRFLLPKKEKKFFENIVIKRPRRQLPVDKLITRKDLSRMPSDMPGSPAWPGAPAAARASTRWSSAWSPAGNETVRCQRSMFIFPALTWRERSWKRLEF